MDDGTIERACKLAERGQCGPPTIEVMAWYYNHRHKHGRPWGWCWQAYRDGRWQTLNGPSEPVKDQPATWQQVACAHVACGEIVIEHRTDKPFCAMYLITEDGPRPLTFARQQRNLRITLPTGSQIYRPDPGLTHVEAWVDPRGYVHWIGHVE